MENENQIFQALGEIKGQISGFMSALTEQAKRSDNHEGRIRDLETKASKQSGVIAGITIAATTVASGIGYLLSLWKP